MVQVNLRRTTVRMPKRALDPDLLAVPIQSAETSSISASPSSPAHQIIQNCQARNNRDTPQPSLLDRIVEFDKRFSAWVHEQGLGLFFYVFLRTLEFSGDGVFLIPCAAATFLAPTPKLTPQLRMFFFNLFMGFLFDLIFVSIIKKIVRRPRPSYNRGHFKTVQVDHWSFPSGHSTRALMVVTFFWLYLPMWRDQSARIWMPFVISKLERHIIILDEFVPTAENLLINIIAWVVTTWAIATTTSRIILGRHFFCDVIAGSLLGVFESFFAHYLLYIPGEVSEYVHQVINEAFGWLEDEAWKLFHGRNFTIERISSR
jgi:membrane-associated phospholipid phosphatase